MAKKKTDHYVDNVEFFQRMCEWKTQVLEAEAMGDTKPPITDYIGRCFMAISNGLSTKPNFIRYEFRDDMIGDGIENCIQYAHNFDPEKSKNPFAYFTQIIYYAFLRRIEKEKKQMIVKYRLAAESENYTSHLPHWDTDEQIKDKLNIKELDLANTSIERKRGAK